MSLDRHKCSNVTTVTPITFMGKELFTVDSVKDLGVVLDSHLSFNEHISTLVSDLMSI